MPKAILEFNLPEENSEYTDAVNGTKHACMIHEITEYFVRLEDHGLSGKELGVIEKRLAMKIKQDIFDIILD